MRSAYASSSRVFAKFTLRQKYPGWVKFIWCRQQLYGGFLFITYIPSVVICWIISIISRLNTPAACRTRCLTLSASIDRSSFSEKRSLFFRTIVLGQEYGAVFMFPVPANLHSCDAVRSRKDHNVRSELQEW